jgi:hypothetical protein
MSYLHSSNQTRVRTALIQMLEEFNASHHITLTFHKHYNLQTATARVTKWYHVTMRQLFGRNWITLPTHERVEFLLLPEMANHLHFHGVVRIPASHLTYFTKIATANWKRHVPTGTLFFGDFYVDKPRETYFTYITKGSLAAEILHSSMLQLPDATPDPDLPHGNFRKPKSKRLGHINRSALQRQAPTSATKVNGIHSPLRQMKPLTPAMAAVSRQ